MMDGNIYIVVEGKEDLRFLEGYLGFLGHAFKSGCFMALEGKDNLEGQMPAIQKKLDGETKVLIILDADEDYAETRKETEEILGDPTLPLFLCPDNQSEGALEDLLAKIILPKHEGIFRCFENYKKCLKGSGYVRPDVLPDMKGKIYAYKEAVGALKAKKNPFDPQYWDFDNCALEPLKKFLTKHISGRSIS